MFIRSLLEMPILHGLFFHSQIFHNLAFEFCELVTCCCCCFFFVVVVLHKSHFTIEEEGKKHNCDGCNVHEMYS